MHATIFFLRRNHFILCRTQHYADFDISFSPDQPCGIFPQPSHGAACFPFNSAGPVGDHRRHCCAFFSGTDCTTCLDPGKNFQVRIIDTGGTWIPANAVPESLQDLERNEKRQKKYNMDFEIEELTSIGTPYDEAVEYVEWKHQ